MSAWTKESDWLPLSNAIAIVDFYLDNLERAIDALEYVESFKAYNLAGYEDMWNKVSGHVNKQKDALKKAQDKLEETKKRITPPNK